MNKTAEVLPFRLALAGNEPPTTSNLWLLELPQSTVFLYKPINSSAYTVEEAYVTHICEKAVKLYSEAKDEYFWVDTETFCRQHYLFEIVYLGGLSD